jgi:hypothetical protein
VWDSLLRAYPLKLPNLSGKTGEILLRTSNQNSNFYIETSNYVTNSSSKILDGGGVKTGEMARKRRRTTIEDHFLVLWIIYEAEEKIILSDGLLKKKQLVRRRLKKT